MTSQRDDHGFDLIGFADGAIEEAERQRVARHLEECPRCADEVRALEAVARAARSLRGSLHGTERALVHRTLDRIAVERAAATAFAGDEERIGVDTAGPARLRLLAAAVLVLGLGWASGWASRAWTASGSTAGGSTTDGTGAADAGTVVAAPEPPTHALFLVASDTLGGTTADRFEAYAGWAAELRAADRLAMAEALTPTAYWIDDRDQTPELATDPPNAMESLLGFYLLWAPSDEAALEIARSSPHIGFGGEVLVRPIYPTPRVEP